MNEQQHLDQTRNNMNQALESLGKEFSGLRTGRAHVSLLEPIVVDAYGSKLPLTQVATVGTLDAQTLTVQVWDKGMAKAVEKSIQDANLGLSPMVDGQLIRVPVPQLTEERRQEMSKVASRYAEEARVRVRNSRRDSIDVLKKSQKDKELSEDEFHKLSDRVQDLTDEHTKKIDDALSKKQTDIIQI